MQRFSRLSLRTGGLATLVLLVAACSAALAFTSPDPGRAEPPPPTPDLCQVWPFAPTPVAPRATGGLRVGDLLAQRPALGEQVEVDAYFAGAALAPHQRGPRPPRGTADCPCSWEAALTDRPFQGLLSILGSVHSNVLPAGQPWLIAAPLDAVWPGNLAVAELPYRARLRGYLGDPAFAHCTDQERILVVMEVVEVFEAEAPPTPTCAAPAVNSEWPRHRERPAGYSLPYPPGWQIERLDRATLVVRAPQWPAWPILVRVHAGETHPDDPASGAAAFLAGDSWGPFAQEAGLGGAGLKGYVVDRYTEPAERAVSVLINGSGCTYELALRYPLGFDALQPLLTAYTAIAGGFRLEPVAAGG